MLASPIVDTGCNRYWNHRRVSCAISPELRPRDAWSDVGGGDVLLDSGVLVL